MPTLALVPWLPRHGSLTLAPGTWMGTGEGLGWGMWERTNAKDVALFRCRDQDALTAAGVVAAAEVQLCCDNLPTQ